MTKTTKSARKVLKDIRKYLERSRKARGGTASEVPPLTVEEQHYIQQLITDWYEQRNIRR